MPRRFDYSSIDKEHTLSIISPFNLNTEDKFIIIGISIFYLIVRSA